MYIYININIYTYIKEIVCYLMLLRLKRAKDWEDEKIEITVHRNLKIFKQILSNNNNKLEYGLTKIFIKCSLSVR